jgi:hypothetical protein
MVSRSKANAIAGLAVVVALIFVSIFLFQENIPSDEAPGPSTKTTRTKSTETTTGGENAGGKDIDSTVRETTEPAPDRDTSPLGKALDNTTVIRLMQVGIALLAAFLVGLFFQRVLLGRYEIKLPFVEVGAITEEKAEKASGEVKDSPKLQEAISAAENVQPGQVSVPDFTAIDDPSVALITLGGSLEAELRKLAEPLENVDETKPIENVIGGLVANEILDPKGSGALEKVLGLSTKAKEGAPVEESVKDWIESEGQQLSNALSVMAEDYFAQGKQP